MGTGQPTPTSSALGLASPMGFPQATRCSSRRPTRAGWPTPRFRSGCCAEPLANQDEIASNSIERDVTRISYLLDNLAPQTGNRFAGLEACFDETTFRHLTAVGIGPGWRCWEVGAGSGSVAGWMADRVGSEGAVLATDLNVDWIRSNISPRVEIRLHDLTSDEIPRSAYDLIHARLVLGHLPQRDAIIPRLVSALASGGWLVLEEFFDAFPGCPEPRTEQERTFEKVLHAFRELLRRREADTTSYPSTLPWRLKRTDLVGVGGEGKLLFARGEHTCRGGPGSQSAADWRLSGRGWTHRGGRPHHISASRRRPTVHVRAASTGVGLGTAPGLCLKLSPECFIGLRDKPIVAEPRGWITRGKRQCLSLQRCCPQERRSNTIPGCWSRPANEQRTRVLPLVTRSSKSS